MKPIAKVFAHVGLSFALILGAFLVLVMRVGAPYHRLGALVLGVGSLLSLAMSMQARRKWIRVQRKLAKRKVRPYYPHLVVALLLVAFGYVFWVLVPVESSPLTTMSDRDLRADLDADRETAAYLDGALSGAVNRLRTLEPTIQPERTLTPSERALLLEHWQQFVHCSLELDVLKRKYKGFYQVDYLTKPALHADAFHVAYSSYVSQYLRTLELIRLVDTNPLMETRLDEAAPPLGIPAQTYFKIKQRLTLPDTLVRLSAGRAYLQLVGKDITVSVASREQLEQDVREIDLMLGRKPELFLDNPLDWLERNAFKAWFPLQKKVAEQMSHLRGMSRPYFISPERAAELHQTFEPADILLERRSWHLTNAGIPGFWPHAALYTGTLEEMDAYFADLPELGGDSASEVLKEKFPKVLADYAAAADEPLRIIEAKRPGVVLTSLEESANADYLGVLRPRVTRSGKWKALCRAFRHHGKPYDFNFDFATDNALVCSELVYKAFNGIEGFRLEPVEMNGRILLPPNDLVRKFAEEADAADRQLDLVLFLDASEWDGQTVIGNAVSFGESWQRPKWEILQE